VEGRPRRRSGAHPGGLNPPLNHTPQLTCRQLVRRERGWPDAYQQSRTTCPPSQRLTAGATQSPTLPPPAYRKVQNTHHFVVT
jgi:hypothetical protein